MWGIIVAILGIVFTGSLAYSEQNLNECLMLSRQLEQMADAQQKVLNSLVKKNDAVADTLDHFADDLGGTGQRVKKTDLLSLRSSAKSFRGHSVREAELVDRFAQKTGALVEKINQCLKKNEIPNSKLVQNSRDSLNQEQR